MNAGKVLFAQLMDFLPWTSFARSVARYGGDRRVRSLSCAEQFRAMAFAQLTFRESLRDIEACLGAQPNKLYHLGFRSPVRRSTLAEANENRDWRIHAEVAQRLIAQARRLYAQESLGVELNSAVYALDSTTIDLCMSLFPWAHFRSAKSAVKMHTLLDLRGSIPAFIRVTTGDTHDVHMLDQIAPEPGAFYVMDRGYLDFARLYRLHQAGAFFVTRAKSNLDANAFTRPLPAAPRASSPIRRSLSTATSATATIRATCAASASATQPPARRWSSLPTSSLCPPRPSARSTRAAGRSNCSSNGSNSTCASRPSTAPARTR